MKTAEQVWERVEVSEQDVGPFMKQLQAKHPDECLFVRRQDGSLLVKVLPNSDAADCLKQLGSNPGRLAIFYERAAASN